MIFPQMVIIPKTTFGTECVAGDKQSWTEKNGRVKSDFYQGRNCKENETKMWVWQNIITFFNYFNTALMKFGKSNPLEETQNLHCKVYPLCGAIKEEHACQGTLSGCGVSSKIANIKMLIGNRWIIAKRVLGARSYRVKKGLLTLTVHCQLI